MHRKKNLFVITLLSALLLMSCEESEPVLYPNCERVLKNDSLLYKVRLSIDELHKLRDAPREIKKTFEKPLISGCIDDSHLYLIDPRDGWHEFLHYITIGTNDTLYVDSIVRKYPYKRFKNIQKTIECQFSNSANGNSTESEPQIELATVQVRLLYRDFNFFRGDFVSAAKQYAYIVGAKSKDEFFPFRDINIYKNTPDSLIKAKKLINAFRYDDSSLVSVPMKSGVHVKSSWNGGLDIKYFREQDSISITFQGKSLKPDSIKFSNRKKIEEELRQLRDFPEGCYSQFCADSLELVEILRSSCDGFAPFKTVFEHDDGRIEFYHYAQISKKEYAKYLHEKNILDSINFKRMRCAPPWHMNVARKYGIIKDY